MHLDNYLSCTNHKRYVFQTKGSTSANFNLEKNDSRWNGLWKQKKAMLGNKCAITSIITINLPDSKLTPAEFICSKESTHQGRAQWKQTASHHMHPISIGICLGYKLHVDEVGPKLMSPFAQYCGLPATNFTTINFPLL